MRRRRRELVLLLIGLLGLLAAGNLLSAAPASLAARIPAAAILRAG